MRARRRTMTRERAAALLAVHRNTVTNLMKSGQLEHAVTPGGYRRPYKDAVIRLMHKRGVAVRYSLVVEVNGHQWSLSYLTRRDVEYHVGRWVGRADRLEVTKEPWLAAEGA
jgi:excisionase family DNA binding protein